MSQSSRKRVASGLCVYVAALAPIPRLRQVRSAIFLLRTGAQGLKSWFALYFLVYGRVPLFYYVLHVYLIHVLAIAVALALRQPTHSLLRLDFSRPWTSYGHGLPFVYAMWIAVVLILYLPCRWFMELKRRRHDWWLQYI
jgi:hypothetical protein